MDMKERGMSEILSNCRVYFIAYSYDIVERYRAKIGCGLAGALPVSSKADGFEGLRSSSGGMNTSASFSAVAPPRLKGPRSLLVNIKSPVSLAVSPMFTSWLTFTTSVPPADMSLTGGARKPTFDGTKVNPGIRSPGPPK